jgi:DNA-binding NarL/FixJ family response regulator
MKTLLVEDDLRVRDVVRALLADSPAHSLVAEARNVKEAIACGQRLAPEAIVLDLGLPDGHGTDVLRALRAAGQSPLALVLTVLDDEASVFNALRAGAVGYLLKDDVVTRLVPSLDDLSRGGSPMSPSIARRVITSFRDPLPADDAPPLTPRERDVVELLAHGSTYDEIGVALGVSTNTIRTYIRSIYEKLHACSKTEAVREAMRRGVIGRP